MIYIYYKNYLFSFLFSFLILTDNVCVKLNSICRFLGFKQLNICSAYNFHMQCGGHHSVHTQVGVHDVSSVSVYEQTFCKLLFL